MNSTTTLTLGRIMNDLNVQGVLMSPASNVEKYLADHTDIELLIIDVCKRIRETFEPTSELALAVYEDPEIEDRYLTLYVRQATYDRDIIERIEAVCGEFQRQLETASGYLLVTTDFRRPGSDHVV